MSASMDLRHALGIVLGTSPEAPTVTKLSVEILQDLDDMYSLQCRRDIEQMAQEISERKFDPVYNEDLDIPRLVRMVFLELLKYQHNRRLLCAETNQAINRIRYAEKQSEYRAW